MAVICNILNVVESVALINLIMLPTVIESKYAEKETLGL